MQVERAMTQEAVVVRVRDWTRTPGARYPSDGPYSGETFRTEVLLAAYDRAKSAGVKLVVDLDGVAGYATSFLDEAFGGVARLRDGRDLLLRLQLICNDEPDFEDEIHEYIVDAIESP